MHGYDALHPRALTRLSHSLVEWFANVLTLGECIGLYPGTICLILIVLLAKADGGVRAIGLMLVLPRIWMRAHRHTIWEWERLHQQPFVYAGVAKGADVVAWRQAASGEIVRTLKLHYAQTLLSLFWF